MKTKHLGPEYLGKHFTRRKEFDSASPSLELSAIEISREFDSLKEAHNEMLKNAKNRKIENVPKIKKLYSILNTLKEKFSKMDEFILNSEKEETRATTKIINEIQTQKHLRKSIADSEEHIHQLCDFKEKLAATVKEMEPYEDVIRKIVDQFDFIKSVKDFTNRCDSLMLAQVEIGELQQQKIKEIEEMRKNMVTVTNEAALTVLGLNNDLTELERSYIKAVNESHFWEREISLVEKHMRYNELKTYRIQDSLQHMVRLLYRRRGIVGDLGKGLPVKESDIEGQFDFIHEEISILKSVINLYEKEKK